MQLNSTWCSAFNTWAIFMKGTMENMYTGQWSVASLELTEVTENHRWPSPWSKGTAVCGLDLQY